MSEVVAASAKMPACTYTQAQASKQPRVRACVRALACVHAGWGGGEERRRLLTRTAASSTAVMPARVPSLAANTCGFSRMVYNDCQARVAIALASGVSTAALSPNAFCNTSTRASLVASSSRQVSFTKGYMIGGSFHLWDEYAMTSSEERTSAEAENSLATASRGR